MPGDEAQNAFLKTLEEPPRGTMLLLLTVNARRLLPTIRSRCQCMSLLRNRQDYSLALQEGLFAILANLRRQAGAKVGLLAAAQISQLFGKLYDLAEKQAEAERDPRWDDVENAQLRKQLAEEQELELQQSTCVCRLHRCHAGLVLAAFNASVWLPSCPTPGNTGRRRRLA